MGCLFSSPEPEKASPPATPPPSAARAAEAPAPATPSRVEPTAILEASPKKAGSDGAAPDALSQLRYPAHMGAGLPPGAQVGFGFSPIDATPPTRVESKPSPLAPSPPKPSPPKPIAKPAPVAPAPIAPSAPKPSPPEPIAKPVPKRSAKAPKAATPSPAKPAAPAAAAQALAEQPGKPRWGDEGDTDDEEEEEPPAPPPLRAKKPARAPKGASPKAAKKGPAEGELLQACRDIKAAHPDFGVKRVFKEIAAKHPNWNVNERRVQKVMRNNDLLVL